MIDNTNGRTVDKENEVTETDTDRAASSLARAVEVIAAAAMLFMVVSVFATTLGVNGLRLAGGPDRSDAPITLTGQINVPTNFGDPLPITVDEATNEPTVFGQAPVALTNPVTTAIDFLDPTPSQRVPWIIWQISGPLVGLAAAWKVFRIARSLRAGDPFTTTNERRLWSIAALVAVGGTATAMISGMARTLIIQRSAAADLFDIEYTISFLPIIIGVAVAALAAVWHVGVELRADADGTI